jgi:hypothetical protein
MLEKRYYILIADEVTWKTAFNEKIFGFSEQSKGLWNTSKENEIVAFYATSPIKKIIGFGKITEKFIDEKIIFPDEKLFKRSMWKYRIKIELLYILKSFDEGIKIPSTIILNTARRAIPKKTFSLLIKEADSKWNTKINQKIKSTKNQ